MRLHSPALAEAFTRGLVDEGCHVLDIGMVGTEMVYYAIGSRELDGGVSVTASHNPKAWAGFKLLREGARALSGRRGDPGRRAASPNRRTLSRAVAGEGSVERERRLRGVPAVRARLHRPGGDPADGARAGRRQRDGGPMIGPILDGFPDHQAPLYFEPNGEFPGPRAEPAACPRTASSSSTPCSSAGPSSGSPGTATPTGASSSTTRESSCPATS